MCRKEDHQGNHTQCTPQLGIADRECSCEGQGLLNKEESTDLLERYNESLESKLEDVEEESEKLNED